MDLHCLLTNYNSVSKNAKCENSISLTARRSIPAGKAEHLTILWVNIDLRRRRAHTPSSESNLISGPWFTQHRPRTPSPMEAPWRAQRRVELPRTRDRGREQRVLLFANPRNVLTRQSSHEFRIALMAELCRRSRRRWTRRIFGPLRKLSGAVKKGRTGVWDENMCEWREKEGRNSFKNQTSLYRLRHHAFLGLLSPWQRMALHEIW